MWGDMWRSVAWGLLLGAALMLVACSGRSDEDAVTPLAGTPEPGVSQSAEKPAAPAATAQPALMNPDVTPSAPPAPAAAATSNASGEAMGSKAKPDWVSSNRIPSCRARALSSLNT